MSIMFPTFIKIGVPLVLIMFIAHRIQHDQNAPHDEHIQNAEHAQHVEHAKLFSIIGTRGRNR